MALSQKSKNISIAVIAIIVLWMQLGLKPYLQKKDFEKTLKKIFEHWQDGEIDRAIDFWGRLDQAPPIFGLDSYKILSSSFGKKDGQKYGEFRVFLDLPESTPLPDKQEWMFTVSKTPYGVKVTDFKPAP